MLIKIFLMPSESGVSIEYFPEREKETDGMIGKKQDRQTGGENGELTLAELPIGAAGTVSKVSAQLRGKKKFADVGFVPGAELVMEGHAPFGGLLRVKVMESSLSLHRDDAANILLKGSAK